MRYCTVRELADIMRPRLLTLLLSGWDAPLARDEAPQSCSLLRSIAALPPKSARNANIARFSKCLKVDAEHRRQGSSDRPSLEAPELNAKPSEGVCHDLVSINVRSAGPKIEPKKSLRMSAPLA
jgi:hypothetical protein